MIQAIIQGIIMGAVVSFMPGAAFFTLITTSVSKGFKLAFYFSLGVFCSDLILVLLTHWGAQGALESISENIYFKYGSGIVFILFGISSFFTRTFEKYRRFYKVKFTPFQLMLKGFSMNLLNPGVIIFWCVVSISAIAKFEINGHNQVIFLGAILFTIFTFDILKNYLSRSLNRFITQKHLLMLNYSLGVILILIGLFFMIDFSF